MFHFLLLAVVSAQSTPPFVNVGAYTASLRSLFGGVQAFNLTITVQPTPNEVCCAVNEDFRRTDSLTTRAAAARPQTLVQTYVQAPYYYSNTTINTTMVSSMQLYGGVMVLWFFFAFFLVQMDVADLIPF